MHWIARVGAIGMIFLAGLSASAQPTGSTWPVRGDFADAPYGGLTDGVYSMRFAIYNQSVGGTKLWPASANHEQHNLVIVMNGVFNVELGTEGEPITDSAARAPEAHLQISVCQPAGFDCSGFESLPFRLPLLQPSYMSLETPIPDSEEDDPEWEVVDAPVGGLSEAWLLRGNAWTDPMLNFLGTTDDSPFSIRVAGLTALRILPDTRSPNLIGGYRLNRVSESVYGATICGGGMLDGINEVHGPFGMVGGGYSNAATGRISVVTGGTSNTSSGQLSFVGGGESNTADSEASSIVGGRENQANHEFAFVGGGSSNQAGGPMSLVTGGNENSALGIASAILGGDYNEAEGDWAGILSGTGNDARGDYSAIGGGLLNEAHHRYSVIGGGSHNSATGEYALVAGGEHNTASHHYASVAGGSHNTAGGHHSFVAGGSDNLAGGPYSFVGGASGRTSSSTEGSFVWAGHQGDPFESNLENEFLVRATSGMFINAGDRQRTDYELLSPPGLRVEIGRSDLGGERTPVESIAGHPADWAVGENPGLELESIAISGLALGPTDAFVYDEITVGVLGQSREQGIGVLGESTGRDATCIGVMGSSLGSHGVFGETASTTDGRAGGFFRATGSSGVTYGVYGEAESADGYGVYSEGDTHVEGALTWTPKKSYISVGPWAFDTNQWWGVEGSTEVRPPIDCPTNYLWDGVYFAPLNLPHGVRLTRVEYHWKDASRVFDCEFRLRRTDLAGGIIDLAIVRSRGNDGTKSQSGQNLDHIVDNRTGTYLLSLDMGCDTWFYGVVIEYEVSEPH